MKKQTEKMVVDSIKKKVILIKIKFTALYK